jgi:hypothetical protein
MGSEMHEDSLMEEKESSTGLLRRGLSIYYVGSMFFVAGIALVALGAAFVMIFQIHYGSEADKILYTTLFLGAGIKFILIGINLMIKQMKKGYYVVGISAIISSFALILFSTNYLHNWYYPLVGYVLGFYVIGFLMLLGNAFANVTLWIIEKNPEYVAGEKKLAKTYTDEEIQRDIEEATRKSIEITATGLQFDVDDVGDIKLGKSSPKTCGLITRVKDDIGEIMSLRQTINPGSTDKWGSIGIDKASTQLAETMMQKKEEKGLFAGFKERLRKRRLEKQKNN